MDTSSFLKWLQGSLTSSGFASGRTILRFARASDYDAFLEALRSARARTPLLRHIRRLHMIRGIRLPLPLTALPAAFADSFLCEEDALISVSRSSLPSASQGNSSLMGIPWGVRRIHAPQAWSRTTGERVKIGVIDTGVDFQHPDLRHALERGINLLQRTMLPQDDNGHGTHIAGTIAAANGSRGMIGVAPRAAIHPVKAFDANGSAYVSDIILGIEWCIRNQMDVVNMSFGMRTRSQSLLNAVESADRAGMLIVASSGNDGRRGFIDYPARFSQTVAVGALTRYGRIAPFTNRSAYIDIYAPGDKVESAWLRGKRRIMSGTSMATSHVTGAVALLLARKPDLTTAQIRDLLRHSAVPLRNSKAPRRAGELDVLRMLRAADALN